MKSEVHVPKEPRAKMLEFAKDVFEVDGTVMIYSTWKTPTADATLNDATRVLEDLPHGDYFLTIKFLREQAEGDWVGKDKVDPIRAEIKKGSHVVVIFRATKPGPLVGIEQLIYQKVKPSHHSSVRLVSHS